MKYTTSLVQLSVDERLVQLRKNALERGIPVADDETLNLLLLTLRLIKPKKILEIGTACGLSTVAMALQEKDATIKTVECDEERYSEAKENFRLFGVENRITAHLGDAAELLSMANGEYDFIFLDGPKAQYEKYLFDLKRLLKVGGLLFSDDVLLYGWVDGKEETPKKRHVIVEKIRSYLETLSKDSDFITSVLDVGDGVALSVLTKKEN